MWCLRCFIKWLLHEFKLVNDPRSYWLWTKKKIYNWLCWIKKMLRNLSCPSFNTNFRSERTIYSIFLSLQNQIQFSLHIFLSNLDIIHLRYALNLLTAQVDKWFFINPRTISKSSLVRHCESKLTDVNVIYIHYTCHRFINFLYPIENKHYPALGTQEKSQGSCKN